MRSLLILSCASVCAMAQPGAVGVPALGYAPDARTNQIRPIRGVPGASLLGEPLDGAFRLTRAVISPRQDAALVIGSEDRQVYLLPFSGAARAIPGAMTAPDTIVFSPSGRSAVLWGGGIQVLRGLGSNPQVTEVSPGAMRAPAVVAVSDDGHMVLAATARDEDPVWIAGPDRAPLQLPLPGSVAAMAFRRDSRDAVAVTRSGDVYWIRNAGPDAEVRLAYAASDQTAGPVAAQISADGSRAFTVNSLGIVAAIDLQTGNAATVTCGCSPDGLEPLRDGLYRLTGISDLPVMLFDASQADSRVWFVPADAAGARSAQ